MGNDGMADHLNKTEARVVAGIMEGLSPREIARTHKLQHDKVDKTLRVLEARRVVGAIRRADGSLEWRVSPPGQHRISTSEVNNRRHRRPRP